MPQAPEIFKRSLDDIKLDGLPPRDDPGFEDAVLQTITLQYAAKGYTAAIVVQNGHVLGVAVPQEGVEPKQYILGLLEHRFLEDALPALEVMAEMTNDPEILYNYGVCLSEMGRVEESVGPLKACVEAEPDYAHAHAALGFAYVKLGELGKAESTLCDAAARLPDDLWINRNLAGLLAKRGKHEDAKPYFERALAANPKDVATLYGLALNLEELGPQNHEQAIGIYQRIIKLEPNSPIATEAKKAISRLAQDTMKSKADGGLRMDAVMYMSGAFETFAKMEQQEVAKVVFEIAKLGESGLSINDPDKRYSLKSL
jgi:tetratricopeptide (TPR) repeat protein